jgi:uncharacterized protein YkwD
VASPALTRQSSGARALVAVLAMVILFAWVPASAQWTGHSSGQLQPAPRVRLFSLMGVEEALFAMANNVRCRHGLPAFLKDERCRDAARAHSADMLNRHYFSHTDPEGRSVKERLPANSAIRTWGENIWTGCGYDPRQIQHLAEAIMSGWMNSPGHRSNILSPEYTHLGVGVITDNKEVEATQVFIGVGDAGVRPDPGFRGR